MLIRIFTLSFDPVLGRFDDTGLQEYIKDKEVLTVTDHFFVKEAMPYLVLVVTCRLMHMEIPSAVSPESKKKESWRNLLDDKDLPLFETLRSWRKERSKADGVPPYVICTNRQLAEITTARPQSLEKIGDINGIGKAKLEK